MARAGRPPEARAEHRPRTTLACGCPIVSTDPSGPREILDGGAFGPLVPLGDDEALAEGIVRALAFPVDRWRLRERAEIFSVHAAVDRYLGVLLDGRGIGAST